jgi:hypothetical protein
MCTLDRDPTLDLILTRYPFRHLIPTPVCRSSHCLRPRRSIDGHRPHFSYPRAIVTIS